MELATLTFLVIIFVLAGAVGYFVVWGVTPALHTPLMAVTNAISGIVVVAAIAVVGLGTDASALCFALECPNPAAVSALTTTGRMLGWLAVVLCAINIFGGFAITRRMLAMFKARPNSEGKA